MKNVPVAAVVIASLFSVAPAAEPADPVIFDLIEGGKPVGSVQVKLPPASA